MPTKDRRVDVYIAKSAPFARPVLRHLRAVVHDTCPEVEETIKWGFPGFLYEGLLCGMAAFKEHCTFGFWKGSLIVGSNGRSADAMGQFGRITRVADLPSKRVLARLVREAMKLNQQGVKVRRAPKAAKPPARVPADLASALKKHRQARNAFDGFSSSQKREYIEWLEEARREETRTQRLETAIEWMSEGKPRNWKYMNR
jgi:uncharacterized protein YdeI (YjbR/CyaY-like superfamily)